MAPAGIETATFQFVAQHLNHCAISVPYSSLLGSEKWQGVLQTLPGPHILFIRLLTQMKRFPFYVNYSAQFLEHLYSVIEKDGRDLKPL